ncbi:MAG: site-2 protease family protein [Verrucomicrobiaceae bacterium]|nr:MAG: site-2 protease family protein [Verrucomicrobiaceae bacterium]
MKWSVRLGRFFGIDVFLHFTFLLFFAWLGYGAYVRSGHDPVQTMHTVALLTGVFTCVILHEYGHALTARRFGIGTHDITLLPIGGARLERMPANPRQELLVAIAGPAVNLAIIFVIMIWLTLRGQPLIQDNLYVVSGSFLRALMAFNATMILFNLLPAFPMDGGRVLRSLLAMRMPHARATRIAATIGQGVAVIFVLVGIMVPNLHMLIFIALFVWIGASNEAEDAEEDSVLTGLSARDAMMTDFHVLSPDQTVQQTVRLIIKGFQGDFPVVREDGELIGIVTRQDVFRVLENENPGPVSSFMRPDPPRCAPSDTLDGVMHTLQDPALTLMPVIDQGRLVGLVTSENVLELLMTRKALSRRQTPLAARPLRA